MPCEGAAQGRLSLGYSSQYSLGVGRPVSTRTRVVRGAAACARARDKRWGTSHMSHVTYAIRRYAIESGAAGAQGGPPTENQPRRSGDILTNADLEPEAPARRPRKFPEQPENRKKDPRHREKDRENREKHTENRKKHPENRKKRPENRKNTPKTVKSHPKKLLKATTKL